MIKAVLIRWTDHTYADSRYSDIEAVDSSSDGQFVVLHSRSKELTIMINVATIRIMTIVNNINDE